MKKVIAAAVAAAFIAPAAFAVSESNVTLYGSLRGFVDYVDGKKIDSAFKVKDGFSRIGFMGADKLNSDVAVIWQVESAVNSNDGEGKWATRNTFVGLDSTWGVIRLGNFDSAYTRMDTSGPHADLFDNYGASVDPKNRWGFYGRANARLKNSISYETQNLNGFIGRLSYGVDNSTQGKAHAWIGSASATFNIGGFTLGAAYQYADKKYALVNLNTIDYSVNPVNVYSGPITTFDDAQSLKTSGAKNHSYKVAASFKFDTGLHIGAAWEHIEDKWRPNTFASFGYTAGGKLKQDTYFVGANHPVGNWLIQAGYGWADKLKGGNGEKLSGTKAHTALLGTQYNLSKRSRIYGYASWVENKSNAAFSTGYDSLNFTASKSDKVQTLANTGHKGYGVSLGFRTDF
jgi:predicted porin